MSERRVGYWVTKKKFEKIDIRRVKKLCEDDGIDLEEMNLEEESPKPYDIILQRASDLVAQEIGGDKEAMALLHKFGLYMKKHPSTTILDPINSIRTISDRIEMCQLFRDKIAPKNVHVPPFTCADTADEAEEKMQEASLSFPLIAKPVPAHDHNLMIILDKEGIGKLRDLTPPFLLQEFIPHDGILYKINVIGDNHTVLTRPSVKNLTESDRLERTISFHTHEVSKQESKTKLNGPEPQKKRGPDLSVVRELVKRTSRETGLTLFGLDLILESGTRKHHIIDINYFPGYDGVKRVPEKLFHLLQAELKKKSIPQ